MPMLFLRRIEFAILQNKYTDLSSTSIGYKLARTHATVLYGIKAVGDRLCNEKDLVEAVATIEQTLKQ